MLWHPLLYGPAKADWAPASALVFARHDPRVRQASLYTMRAIQRSPCHRVIDRWELLVSNEYSASSWLVSVVAGRSCRLQPDRSQALSSTERSYATNGVHGIVKYTCDDLFARVSVHHWG